MKVVYLTTPGTMVKRKGDRLQVWQGSTRLDDLRLFELERLVIFGSVQLTTQALALLFDKGTDVSFLTPTGRLRGSLVSGVSRNVFLRLAQFDRWKDDDFRLAFSRQVATAKVYAQERLLARFMRNHPQRIDPEAKGRLAAHREGLVTAATVDEVRGLEGAAAATYFKQLARMMTRVAFPGRKKHPATDPANSLLSLGYVLLTNEIAALIEARGFDPCIGFMHGVRYGRQSLALDLVEPFRQPVIDRLTLRLLNRGQISPEEFEGGEKGFRDSERIARPISRPDSGNLRPIRARRILNVAKLRLRFCSPGSTKSHLNLNTILGRSTLSESLRLEAAAFKRFLGEYEGQLRSPSEGEGSATWRACIRKQVNDLKEMVMNGEVGELHTWNG